MKSREESIAQSTKILSSSTVIFRSRFTCPSTGLWLDPSSKSTSKSEESAPDPADGWEVRTSKVDEPRELTHLHSSHWPSDKDISIFDDKSDFPSIHLPFRYHLFMRHNFSPGFDGPLDFQTFENFWTGPGPFSVRWWNAESALVRVGRGFLNCTWSWSGWMVRSWISQNLAFLVLDQSVLVRGFLPSTWVWTLTDGSWNDVHKKILIMKKIQESEDRRCRPTELTWKNIGGGSVFEF